MPTIINGSTGIDQVQSGVITPDDLNTAVNPSVQRIQTFTAQASTAGTSIDFTGIPTWAKEITIAFNGVSTNGTSVIQVQLNNVNTGYSSTATGFNATTMSAASIGTGFGIAETNTAAFTFFGSMVLTNVSGNIWTYLS